MKPRSSSSVETEPNVSTRGMRPSDDVGVRSGRGVKIEKAVTINRSAEELFSFWRNFENLPRVMEHIESVVCHDERRSHWRARIADDKMMEWDAEVINEHPNELIAWQSLPGSDVREAGTVRFTEGPGGLGTEMKLTIEYEAAGGLFTNSLARLFRRSPEQQISEDLRHLKQLMEAGEIPTIEDQPAAREESKAEKYEEAK